MVGNGPSILNGEYAELIDSYKVVVRFNWFHLKGFEKNVGNKTDIWFTTAACPTRMKWFTYQKVYEHSWQFDPAKDKTYQLMLAYRPDCIKVTSATLDEMQKYSQNKSYRTYSTGAIAAWMFLKEYPSVDMIGFDWWQEAKHHYGDTQQRGTIHKPEEEFKFFARLVAQGKVHDLNPKSLLNDEKKIWETVHQPFELSYHKQGNYRWRDMEWESQWNAVFEFAELSKDAFNHNEILLDVGCGSRPCLEWFTESRQCTRYYLDPLLNDYIQIPKMRSYWEDKKDFLLSVPAEQRVDSMVGRCDYVHCWNVLDHCFSGEQVLKNIVDYAKPGGIVLIGTDFGNKSNIGHPGLHREVFDEYVQQYFEVLKQQFGVVHRQLAVKLKRKSL